VESKPAKKETEQRGGEQRFNLGKKRTYDYYGTSQCGNQRLLHKDDYECIAQQTDCRYYEEKRKNGLKVGICRVRYDAKLKKKKSDVIADNRETKKLSEYTGRRIK
jgi:hypothetical protein